MRISVILLMLVVSIQAGTHQALVINNHIFGKEEVPGALARGKEASRKLTVLGYEVTEVENVSDFLRLFESFASRTLTGGVSVIYFTGYGNRYSIRLVNKIRQADGSETIEESFVSTSGIWDSRGRSEPWSLDQLLKPFVERSRAHTHHFVFECPDPCPRQSRDHEEGIGFPVDPDFLNLHFYTKLPALASAGKQPLKGDLPGNPRPGDEWMNRVGMTFCYCPPGKFKMGLRSNEVPQNRDTSPV